MVRKFFAGFLVLLIVLPFTEPWPTCPLIRLTRPGGPSVDQASLVASQLSLGTQLANSISENSAALEIANPITLLPPPRTPRGTLRMNGVSAPLVLPTVLGRTAPMPIHETPGVRSRSGPSAQPPLTLALRL